MTDAKRGYVSIYFPEKSPDGTRRTRNVCVSFSETERHLEQKFRKMGSTALKKYLGIHSYEQLCRTAEREGRTISGLIKHRLRQKGSRRESELVTKWVRWLKQMDDGSGIAEELIRFITSKRD